MSLSMEQAGAKEVSVLIPTHRRSELLEPVLLALSGQTFPQERFEVVVVVDGSSDRTREMLQNIQLPYRLRVFYREQSGVAATRNFGAGKAVGKVILFLDDDVIPSPQLIAEHMRFHSHDDKAAVIGRLLPNVAVKRQGWSRWEEAMLEKHYQAMQNGGRPPAGRRLYTGNFSVSRQNLLHAGSFDENLKCDEDVELGYRLEAQGMHFYFNAAAEATHCGYRSFNSWSRMPRQYGQWDVIIARDKCYPGLMGTIFSWYHGRHVLIRLLTRVFLGRAFPIRAAVLGMHTAARIARIFRLEVVSRYAYSGIYNLLYWQGVADELGGVGSFWRYVRQFRPTPEIKKQEHEGACRTRSRL